MSDLFISYSRRDQAFVRRLHDALAEAGTEAWVDWEDIPASAKWLDELRGAVEAADAFAFVISPDSVTSDFCRQEAEHAAASGKRIIPILWREVDVALIPEAVAAHNWISLREEDDFEQGLATLVAALETDLEWARAHTRVLTRGLEWERAKRDPSFLLRGRDLEAAELWLTTGAGQRTAQPTPLQAEYIVASRRAATRGARIRTAAVTIALVISLGLAAVAFVQLLRAEGQTRIAEGRELAQASANQLPVNPELALLLAIKGVERSQTLETDQALRVALQGSRIRTAVPTGLSPVGAAFSMAADRVVVGGTDGALEVWDVAGATPVVHLAVAGGMPFSQPRPGVHFHPAETLALTSDGARAVAVDGEGTLRIWNVGSRALVGEVATSLPGVIGLALSPDNSQAVLASVDGSAEIWDLEGGGLVRSFPGTNGVVLADASFSPDGQRLAIAGWDGGAGGAVRILDVRSGDLLQAFDQPANTLSWSADGSLLGAGDANGIATVWDTATGATIATLEGHQGQILSLAFDRAGTRVVTTSDDGTARVWPVGDPFPLVPVVILRADRGAVVSAAFAPNGSVASVGVDGAVRTWSATATDPGTVLPLGEWLEAVTFSADGTRVTTASDDRAVRIWDTSTGRLVAKLAGHSDRVTSLASDPAGRLLASGSLDGTVRLWSPSDGSLIRELGGRGGPISDVAIDPLGIRLIETNGVDTAVWDTETGSLVGTFPIAGSALDVAADGKTLAVGGRDGVVALIDLATGRVIRSLVGHTNLFAAVRFDPQGTRIATASADGTTRIWTVGTGATSVVLRADAGPVSDVSWSRDGRRIATAHDDGQARVWDPITGERLATYRFDPERMSAIAFAPDGKSLVGGHLYSAWFVACDVCGGADEVLRLAHARVTRALTPDEEAQFLHLTPDPVPNPSAPTPVESEGPSAPEPRAESTPSPSVGPPSDSVSRDLCEPREGSCELAPGTYRASGFALPFTVSVGEGWENVYAENFVNLAYLGATGSLVVLADVAQGERFGSVVELEPGAASTISYLQTRRELKVSSPVPAVVGGVTATEVEVSVGDTSGAPVGLLYTPQGLLYLSPVERLRVIALEINDKTVVILEDVLDAADLDRVMPIVQQVVSTIEFE